MIMGVNQADEVWVVAAGDGDVLESAMPRGAGLVVVASDPVRAGDAVARLAPDVRRVSIWLEPEDVDGLREMIAELYPGATVVVQTTSLPLAGLI